MGWRRHFSLGLFIGFAFAIGTSYAQESREQLVAAARDRNRAAIESIRTMECRFERVLWDNTAAEHANKDFQMWMGRYWRQGDAFRVFYNVGDGSSKNYVVRDGVLMGLRTFPAPYSPILHRTNTAPIDGVGGFVWEWLLFSHWGWLSPPDLGNYPLWDILDHPHRIRAAERLPMPGNEIRLELTNPGARLELWLDPKVNYLVRKTITFPAANEKSGKNIKWEHEVIEFNEAAKGVFIPIVIQHRCYHHDQLHSVVRTRITDLKVNHNMPATALRIPGIAGMECSDMTRDVKYKVDADGRQVGPAVSEKVPEINPKPSDAPPGTYSSPEPSRPPMPWWRWLLSVSLFALIAGLSAAVVRLRLQQRSNN